MTDQASMQFGWIDTVVFVAYLIGIIAVGLWHSRNVRKTGDFFAGGRRFNKFLMVMHALGTGTHADDPVGVVGASFQRGISGIWYSFVYLFVTPFYWIIAPLFRRTRYLTTADLFDARYGRGLGLLYAVMGILYFAINMGTMLKGTGFIAVAITHGRLPEWLAISGMTLVFLAYGAAGGLVSTVVIESIQGVLIVVMSLLLVPFALAKVGGFEALHASLEPSFFSLSTPHELTLMWIVGACIASLIGIVSQPHTMEICATGKTEMEGRVGFTYGNFTKRICAIGWAFTGLLMAALVAQGAIPGMNHREEAFGTAILYLLPVGFTGLMVVAILAAQMSTLSAFMVAGSALVSRNLYQRYLHPGASDQALMKVARISGLAIVLLAVAFSLIVPGVTDALAVMWQITTLTGLLVWAAFLWRRATALGAWLAFGVMAPIWLVLGPFGKFLHDKAGLQTISWLGMLGDKTQMHWLLLSYLPLGLLTLVAASLLSRQHDQRSVDQFYTLLRTPVGREPELVEQGIPVVYAGSSEGHPWELNHPKLVQIGGFLLALAVSGLFLAVLWWLVRIGA